MQRVLPRMLLGQPGPDDGGVHQGAPFPDKQTTVRPPMARKNIHHVAPVKKRLRPSPYPDPPLPSPSAGGGTNTATSSKGHGATNTTRRRRRQRSRRFTGATRGRLCGRWERNWPTIREDGTVLKNT